MSATMNHPWRRRVLPLKAWEYRAADGGVFACAWCQREQGVKPEGAQSHGVCPQHKEGMLKQMGVGRSELGVAA